MDIEDIVNYAILIGVAVAIILLLTGKFIDLSVLRQESLQTRETINLLQDIVTSGPFLVTDSGGNPMKLMIDKSKLSDPSLDITKCCDNVKYDYSFGIADSATPLSDQPRGLYQVKSADSLTKTNFNGPEKDFNFGDYCYTGFGVNGKYASTIPVNLCDKNDPNTCKQGLAAIETTDSPLSELTYWITQACELSPGSAAPGFDLDLTKRITLSEQDYRTGADLNASSDEVCFKGVCKKVTCGGVKVDTVPGPVDKNNRSTLYDQEVPRWPIPARCNFVFVQKNNTGVHLIVPFLPKPSVPSVNESGLFFLPDDQDRWTEGYTSHMISIPSGHEIVMHVDDISAVKGQNYIALQRSPSESAGDISMNMFMGGVKEPLDKCVVDKDPTGPGATCVNMTSRGLDTISFQARLHFNGAAQNKEGYLTWKIFDSNGACIQKKYGALGFGKDTVESDTWSKYVIDKNSAETNYGGCIIASGPLDFLNKIAQGVGTAQYPANFNWGVANIEFDACEKALLGVTCVKQLDTLDSLMVDNFYFQGTRKQ